MKKLSLLFLVLVLSSCASMRYGDFTKGSLSQDAFLANDATLQLTQVFPPAHNTFYLSQKTNNGFGLQLVNALRKKGYGVIENVQARQKANFFYVVDEVEPRQIYRVSLYINTQALNRLYVKSNHGFVPVSAWSHKEPC